MIRGIGIDIVRIDRMKRWIVRPLLMKRYFHEKEIEAAKSRGAAFAMALAARFAAKEAFGKALGTGLMGISLKEIQVENNINGKPGIILYGKAKAAYEKTGGKIIHLSLTHETDNAVAVVVIES
ncbi:MAG: holo-ACP synthase [Spirochaetia bacterium]|jgi:holo-[acyl-carrier protein] synthase|nr:holo-ACP synthase [Spirochaetia bacterium]